MLALVELGQAAPVRAATMASRSAVIAGVTV
jgi:hypothetical protein